MNYQYLYTTTTKLLAMTQHMLLHSYEGTLEGPGEEANEDLQDVYTDIKILLSTALSHIRNHT